MRPILYSVLHPTDFSDGSRIAFFHALKAALVARAKLTLLNVSADTATSWTDFPGVRETLEKWNLLAPGSPKSAVADLGIDVQKAITMDPDPVKAVVGFQMQHPADLIVLATQQRTGAMRWLGRSVAEPIARHSGESTLFIPNGCNGFVSGEDGSVNLRNVLVPVAHSPEPQPAIDAAARLVRSLDSDAGVFRLLHVGDRGSVPAVHLPEVSGWEWKRDVRQGDVVQTIDTAAKDTSADLIVMTTDGRDGFLDGLRGSHTERVLRLAGTPLLTVPVGSLVYDVAG